MSSKTFPALTVHDFFEIASERKRGSYFGMILCERELFGVLFFIPFLFLVAM